jgi:hypothetical protein
MVRLPDWQRLWCAGRGRSEIPTHRDEAAMDGARKRLWGTSPHLRGEMWGTQCFSENASAGVGRDEVGVGVGPCCQSADLFRG